MLVMITKVILMNVDANGWMERGRRCVCTSKLAVRWARGGGSVLALPHTPQSHIHNSSIVVRPATETTSPTPVSKGKTPDASLRLSLFLISINLSHMTFTCSITYKPTSNQLISYVHRHLFPFSTPIKSINSS